MSENTETFENRNGFNNDTFTAWATNCENYINFLKAKAKAIKINFNPLFDACKNYIEILTDYASSLEKSPESYNKKILNYINETIADYKKFIKDKNELLDPKNLQDDSLKKNINTLKSSEDKANKKFKENATILKRKFENLGVYRLRTLQHALWYHKGEDVKSSNKLGLLDYLDFYLSNPDEKDLSKKLRGPFNEVNLKNNNNNGLDKKLEELKGKLMSEVSNSASGIYSLMIEASNNLKKDLPSKLQTELLPLVSIKSGKNIDKSKIKKKLKEIISFINEKSYIKQLKKKDTKLCSVVAIHGLCVSWSIARTKAGNDLGVIKSYVFDHQFEENSIEQYKHSKNNTFKLKTKAKMISNELGLIFCGIIAVVATFVAGFLLLGALWLEGLMVAAIAVMFWIITICGGKSL